MDGQMDEWVDGLMNGWIDRWMDRWINGEQIDIDGQTYGIMNVHTHNYTYTCTCMNKYIYWEYT